MKINHVFLTVILLGIFFNVSAGHLAIARSGEFQTDTVASLKGKLVDLGPQITSSAIQSAAFIKDKEGRNLVFTVARGQPAHLIGYELASNTLIIDIPLDSMVGAWSMVGSSDGVLYIGGGLGHLYKYTPGDVRAISLGLPLGDQTYTWDLKAGKNGEIFGATYPGCRIFRYHPKDGYFDIGKGAIAENENYARGFDIYQEKGKIYVGVGSHASLVELDISTGTKKNILPEKYRNQEFVYDVKIIRGINGGDRLLANVTTANKTIIYNLQTEKWESEIDKISIRTALKSHIGNTIYYGDDRDFFSASFDDTLKSPIKLGRSSNILASMWESSDILVMFNRYGQLIKYNTLTGQSRNMALNVPPQPISINAVHLGSDGRIWTGGYLSGSNAAYDPKTGKSEELRGMSQTEGITLQNKNMYFGIYPSGRLYLYDTGKPWHPAKQNPAMIARIPGQSRFYAGVDMGDDNTMFFGSVPEYGHLGGALVEYKSQSGKIETYLDVVPQLSIVSLTRANSMVIGGTSVWGGLGIMPAKIEASLFGWDVAAKKKSFEVVPVPGAKAITAVVSDQKGIVWGVADGVLFSFDPIKQVVLSRQEIFHVSDEQKKVNVWHSVSMLQHPDGSIYLTGKNKMYKFEPADRKVSIILENASKLSMDNQGRFYFSRGTHLWQYTPVE